MDRDRCGLAPIHATTPSAGTTTASTPSLQSTAVAASTRFFRLSAVLDELEAFAGGAECLLGGNLMAIDLLHLQVVRFSNPMNDGIHVPRVSELDNQSDTLLDDSPDRTYRPSLLRE